MIAKTDMKDYYEKMYDDDTDIARLRKLKSLTPFKRIKKELFIRHKIGTKILEAGCGLGEYLDLFEGNLVGTDLSLNALKKARIFCPKADYFQANSEKIPLKDESFDCILLPDVIEHVEDDMALFKEAHRILKKGGRILVTSHFSGGYDTKACENVNLWDNVLGEGGDLRIYGLDLVDKLKNMGFKKIELRFLYGPITTFVNRLKTKILKKRGFERKDILSGEVVEKTKNVKFYVKILFMLYKLDYLLFSKRKGHLFFLAMEKD